LSCFLFEEKKKKAMANAFFLFLLAVMFLLRDAIYEATLVFVTRPCKVIQSSLAYINPDFVCSWFL